MQGKKYTWGLFCTLFLRKHLKNAIKIPSKLPLELPRDRTKTRLLRGKQIRLHGRFQSMKNVFFEVGIIFSLYLMLVSAPDGVTAHSRKRETVANARFKTKRPFRQTGIFHEKPTKIPENHEERFLEPELSCVKRRVRFCFFCISYFFAFFLLVFLLLFFLLFLLNNTLPWFSSSFSSFLRFSLCSLNRLLPSWRPRRRLRRLPQEEGGHLPHHLHQWRVRA